MNEERSYSARQLSQKLAQEKQVKLGAEQVRRILVKKKWRWKRLRKKPPQPQNLNYKEAKKNDLPTLKLWSQQKLITLLYLDESGCCLESPLSYGYGQIGQQKSISQNKNRGRRINIMGVWEDNQSFEYVLKVGTYKAKNGSPVYEYPSRKSNKKVIQYWKIHCNCSG